MHRYILTCPGRKPVLHDGFALYTNEGGHYEHNWQKCAFGHGYLLEHGDGPCLIVEDDVAFPPDFEERLARLISVVPHNGVGMGYVCVDLGLPVDQIPMVYPPDSHDWGTQCTYYTPQARKICQYLIAAYLEMPVATVVSDYRIPEKIRPRPTRDGVQDGFDVWMFKSLRLLGVQVVCYPCVQHVGKKSKCLSSPHRSPFFPKKF